MRFIDTEIRLLTKLPISTRMKPTLQKVCCVICLSLSVFVIQAQDIHFSQFFETPLLRNPALAGIFSGDVRLQTVYRNQWNSVTVPYQTTSINTEFKKPIGRGDDFITFGGQLLYDRAGTAVLTATHVLPAFNYHKSLSADRNMYLSLGFMGGMVQRRIDRSKITTNSQFDGTSYNPNLADGETFPRPSYTYMDGSVGMTFNSQVGQNEDNNIYIGLAYHHFNKAKKISFYSSTTAEMMPKWVASAGVRMNMTDYSFFTMYADFSKQGPHTETIAGVLYSQKLDDMEAPRYIIHGGAFMRLKDAIIPTAKLDFLPMSVSVSYDINLSQLRAASQGRGGFEFALTYQKFFDRHNTSKEAVRCPKF